MKTKTLKSLFIGLVFGLPVALVMTPTPQRAFADAATYLKIDGSGIVDNNSSAYSDASISWNESSKTLTLNNYDYLPIEICREDLKEANLVLNGENKIRNESVADGVKAFTACPHLEISGEGSLKIELNSENALGVDNVLLAKNGFTLNSGTILADTRIGGNSVVKGGYLGGNLGFPNDLDSSVDFDIEDGKVNLIAIDYLNYYGDGDPYFSLNISGGTTTILSDVSFNHQYDKKRASYNIGGGVVNILQGSFLYGALTVSGGELNFPIIPDNTTVSGGTVNATKDFSNEAINDAKILASSFMNQDISTEQILDGIYSKGCGFSNWAINFEIQGGVVDVSPYCGATDIGEFKITNGTLNAPGLRIAEYYIQEDGEVNIVGGGIMLGAGREGGRDRSPVIFRQSGGKLAIDDYLPEEPALYVHIGYAVFDGGETKISGGSVPILVEFPGDFGNVYAKALGSELGTYEEMSGIKITDADSLKEAIRIAARIQFENETTEEQKAGMCSDVDGLNNLILEELNSAGADASELPKSSFADYNDCMENVIDVMVEFQTLGFTKIILSQIDDNTVSLPEAGGIAFNGGDVSLEIGNGDKMIDDYKELLCPHWKKGGFSSYEDCLSNLIDTEDLDEYSVMPMPIFVTRTLSSDEYGEVDPSTLSTDESAIQIGEGMISNPEKMTVAVIQTGDGYDSGDAPNGATFGDGEGEVVLDFDNQIAEHIPTTVRIYRYVEPEPEPEPEPKPEDEEEKEEENKTPNAPNTDGKTEDKKEEEPEEKTGNYGALMKNMEVVGISTVGLIISVVLIIIIYRTVVRSKR